MKNRIFAVAMATVGAMMMCSFAAAQATTNQTTTTQTTNPATGTTTTQTTSTTVMPDMSNRLSVGDQIFLMNLIHANALEIELSRVAVRQAASKGVSDFALMMINDHTNLQNQLANTYGSQPWMYDWQNSLRKTNQYNSSGLGSYYNGSSYTTTNAMTNSNGQSTTTTTTTTTQQPTSVGPGAPTVPTTTFDNWMYLDSGDWEKIHRLESLQGFPFDKEYVQMMVIDHRKLMDQFYNQQDLSSNDVRTLANTVQGTVQNHLEEARRLSFNYDDPFDQQRSWAWIH